MKKILLIFLAVLLVLGVACDAKEDAPVSDTVTVEVTEEEKVMLAPKAEQEYEPMPDAELPLIQRLPGEWYAGHDGLVLSLDLSEDGTYKLRVPGKEDVSGTWALTDGLVVLDGKEADAIIPLNGFLRWDNADLLFSREKPVTYEPAEINTKAQTGDFDGYWKSHFVSVGDGTMLSSAFGENTDIYVEGTRVALGGKLFGDTIVDMELSDGTLKYLQGGVTVTLAMQQDGWLRMTMDGSDPVTIYLIPAYTSLGKTAG